jgi:predicted PurR-regulated permease PerM
MANSAPTEHRAFLLLLGVLTLLGLYLVSPFLNAIVLAIALAILFQPLHGVFLRWTAGRPNAATLLSVSSVVFLLLLPLAAVMTLATGQLSALIIPSTETPSEVTVSEFLGYLQQRIVSLSARFERLVGIPLHLDALVRKGLSNLAEKMAPYSPKVFSETINFFMHLFIFLVLLTYFLRDGKRFLTALIRITPIKDHYEHRLAGEIRSIIQAIFYGQFLTSLLQAMVATAAFYFLGIDGYLVWGCLIFFVSFLPLLGTGAVLAPMTIVLFVQGKPMQGVLMLICALLVGSIDNLLRPFLMRSNMHSLFVFLGLFGGLLVFGPIGILLGPMLMALLTATVRMYAEDFAHEPLWAPETPRERRIRKEAEAAQEAVQAETAQIETPRAELSKT